MQRHAHPAATLAVLMAGTFMVILDFFIVNVALPDMTHRLHTTADTIEWVVAGYGLTMAVSLIAAGRLGDRFGRRRLFAAGLAIFVGASTLTALAWDPGVLVAGRLVQGVGAALLQANTLAILGVAFSGHRQVRAISIYGMTMGLAATAGQIIGGVLLRADLFGLGWRTVFWINVPIGLGALAAVRLVPESRNDDGAGVDVGGIGLLTVALVALVLPLVQGRQAGWPVWSFVCLAVSPLLFAAFGVWERRRSSLGGTPLLDATVFAARPLRAGLLTQTVFWCQQAAAYLFIALYLQDGRGDSPLRSGLVFSVLAAGYLVTSLRAPDLVTRFGPRVVAIGALTGAAGDLLLANAGGSMTFLLPGLFVLGAGQGLCITPLTTTILAHARPSTAGSVSGALTTVQQIGNSLGVAVIGVVFFDGVHHGYLAAFDRSFVALGALLLAVALLSRMMGRAPVPTETGVLPAAV